MITLEKASKEAIRYACRYFHYAGHSPAGNVLGYSVFNDGVWCGVVTFGSGANNNIGKAYGLKQGEVCELTRVALNGKQTLTSQVVSMCLKRLKKDAPLVRLVVSYADADMEHYGTIYQATNWIRWHKFEELQRWFMYHSRGTHTWQKNIKLHQKTWRFEGIKPTTIYKKIL